MPRLRRMTSTATTGPLQGLRILDISTVIAGPWSTTLLADLGAEVLKVEMPGSGDALRALPPYKEGVPLWWKVANRNKRGITLDLRREEGRALLGQLLPDYDVLVENFRPGTMEKLGYGWETLHPRYPKLIYAAASGFGHTGPYSHKGGQDVLAQALSGTMHRRSDPHLPLSIYPTTFADYSAGMHMVQGVLLALLQRAKTGRGQRISVSLYDSMLAAQTQEGASQLMRGREVNWGAMPLSGVFETSDGAIALVGAFKAQPLRDICTALEIDDLSPDARFAAHAVQVENKPALHDIFRARFASNTTAYWLARLEEQDLLCAPVRTLTEALADEQTAVNGMIMEADGEFERVKVIGSPIHMDAAPVSIRIPPAHLGQYTDAVLAELGMASQAAE